jgi:hypothetical protein
VPDPTEGITDPRDLPHPKVVKCSRNFKRRLCPHCGKSCPRDRVVTRVLRDLGDWIAGRPCDIHLTCSQHHCTLREIMDETYRLFDRRCHTDTALEKLASSRARVHRFGEVGKTLSKLMSPNLDRALTFLDDRLLPSTSNAVERGNRRHRKMQKTVYRVRTKEHIVERIALGMLRDLQNEGRGKTIETLHHQRAA